MTLSIPGKLPTVIRALNASLTYTAERKRDVAMGAAVQESGGNAPTISKKSERDPENLASNGFGSEFA